MAQTSITVILDDAYQAPTGAIPDVATYVNFIMNSAAQSYKSHHGTADLASAIAADLAAYNATIAAQPDAAPDAAQSAAIPAGGE